MSENTHLLKLGSLLCRVTANPPRFAEVLSDVYGTPLLKSGEPTLDVQLEIRIVESPDLPIRGSDELQEEAIPGGFLFDSDPLNIRLQFTPSYPIAVFEVKQPAMLPDQLAFHLWLLSNRMLLRLDRMLLHTAAIEYGGRVSLFCGRRGAGKSTLSIALGKAGATILAEDHVILHQRESDYLVSGCTSRVRVTSKTEEHLLQGKLDAPAVDVGGIPKKDFPADRFFQSCPYEDRTPDLLFMTRVGEKFSVREISPQRALLGMMDVTGEMLRFRRKRDYDLFLDFLAGFVRSVQVFSLELSPDISELQQLPAWLRDFGSTDHVETNP